MQTNIWNQRSCGCPSPVLVNAFRFAMLLVAPRRLTSQYHIAELACFSPLDTCMHKLNTRRCVSLACASAAAATAARAAASGSAGNHACVLASAVMTTGAAAACPFRALPSEEFAFAFLRGGGRICDVGGRSRGWAMEFVWGIWDKREATRSGADYTRREYRDVCWSPMLREVMIV